MKTSTKIILSALVAVGVTMVAAASTTGTDHGYYYMLYQSGGSASITFPSAGTYAGNFQVSFSGCSDVVGGKGWATGAYRTINYNAGYISNPNNFGAYGWTTGTLREYYVCESGSVVAGTYKGSVTSDGHTYSTYQQLRSNAPSIIGTATFYQNLDNWGGTSTGASHAINMSNHFSGWTSKGMGLGTQNLQVVEIENYNYASGGCNATVW